MDDVQSFGRWLRRRRRELDLTQEELARQVGCASITIRKLEAEHIRPSKKLAEALGKPLGVPEQRLAEFIGFARQDQQILSSERFQPYQPQVTTIPANEHFLRPSGTLTLLLSELGGSTHLASFLGDRYAAVVEQHRLFLREIYSRWNGHEVLLKGDSLFVVFSRSIEAVSAAVEVQRAMAATKWAKDLQLRVRIGIHTGEPALVHSEYIGVDVDRVIRICEAAHAGQVLISESAQALVERKLPLGVMLRELGDFRLRGLDEPERIFQLIIPGLPSDFPRLRTENAAPANLPTQLSTFIGREQEITNIRALLKRSRLVTLTGAGGSGKTRLAIEVATQVLDQFSEGVWLLDFAPLREAGLIEQAIASVLGVLGEAHRSIEQTLLDYLRPRSLLLIFDNCEHLVERCAHVADVLLQACPQLQILATSREALGIPGESQYTVPTLTLPDADAELSPESLKQSEAARVFLDRATMARPAFDLDTTNLFSVARICRRLDGMPLAIELAAARVKSLNPQQIADRLNDRFELLSAGNRAALPRHQTLRATIDWSYNLLTDRERVVFARLSVFAGSWSLEAATDVCRLEDASGPDALSILLNLVDKSLVNVEEQDGQPRYRFLETIREYALEKLVDSGDEPRVRTRFLEYLTALADRAEANYRGPEQLSWFRLMERERDNFRAALDYSLHSNEALSALRLVGSAFWLWFFRGPWSEGEAAVQAILDRTPDEATVPRSRALMALGLLRFEQSHHAAAQAPLEQSLAIWRSLGEKWWCALVLAFLGRTVQAEDAKRGIELVQQSLELALETEENWIIALALWNWGETALNQMDLAAARNALEKSLKLSEVLGDKMLRKEVLRSLGDLTMVEEDYARAVVLYEQSLMLVRELGDTISIARLHYNLGRASQLAGDNEQAARHFMDMVFWSRRLGKKASLVAALAGLAVVASARGEARRAVQLFSATQVNYTRLGLSLSTIPDQLAWYERHLESARSALGQAESGAAWAQGQALTLDEAVSYALGSTSLG